MPEKQPYLVYDAVRYDEASAFFPIASLPADAVVRDAAAGELVEATPDGEIVAVAPVSTATAYRLAHEPLTAVRLGRIPDTPESPLPSDEYELLVVGRPRTRRNHSLTEYA